MDFHISFSSRVCARTVGGIYTVIQTKARLTAEEWGENYFLVGPYVESNVRTQVELIEPTNPILKRTIEKMNSSGCKVPERVHSGRTVTPLSPLFFFFFNFVCRVLQGGENQRLLDATALESR